MIQQDKPAGSDNRVCFWIYFEYENTIYYVGRNKKKIADIIALNIMPQCKGWKKNNKQIQYFESELGRTEVVLADGTFSYFKVYKTYEKTMSLV